MKQALTRKEMRWMQREKRRNSALRRLNAPFDKERRVRRAWIATFAVAFSLALLYGGGVTEVDFASGVQLGLYAAGVLALVMLALVALVKARLHVPPGRE